MAIVIEKRVKVDDTWSLWEETNDVAPFVNTDIVEYRLETIVTNGLINGYYDNFIDKGVEKLTTLFHEGNMSGEEQASVISTLLDSSMKNSLGAIELGYKLEFSDAQTKTEIMKQKRQYGATVGCDGNITYSTDGKSVIEKQIAGFDKSNLKSILQSFQQAVGMIYNSGDEVPAWFMDVIKGATEQLADKKIDLQKDETTGDTVMTDETNWVNK